MSDIFREVNQRSEETIAHLAPLSEANGKAGWVCPKCGGGSNGKGYGIRQRKHDGKLLWYCNKCCKGEHAMTNADVLGWAWGLDPDADRQELARKLRERLGREKTSPSTKTFSFTENFSIVAAAEAGRQLKDYTRLYSFFRSQLSAFLDTQPDKKWRGLTFETLFKAGAGYNPKYRSMIFPFDAHNFFWRSVDETLKENHRGMNDGGSYLGMYRFNLKSDVDTVFITEGVIDCLSVVQAFKDFRGIGFAAAGSANLADNAVKVLSELYKNQNQKPEMFWLADRDIAGLEAGREFVDGMESAGFKARRLLLPEKILYVDAEGVIHISKNDANEYLQEHGEIKLLKSIAKAIG